MANKGRKPAELDMLEIQRIICELEEGESPPKNRTELWKQIANKLEVKVSHQTIMNRCLSDASIQIKTPKGHRGKQKGEAPPANSRQRKVYKFTKQSELEIKKQFKQLGPKTVNRVLSGSVRAAIKAFCWDCCGWSKKEVALCTMYACPLWIHRPWKKNAVPHTEEKKSFPLTVVTNDNADANAGSYPVDD